VSDDYRTSPVDHQSAEQLNGHNLRLGLVDTSATDAFVPWLEAVTRGFLGPRPSEESIAEQLRGLAQRRSTGVWDDTALDPATPVGTVSSWPTRVAVPGERSVAAWAISAVTVSPSYRRRGIAKALLEAELRTAHRLGIPVAVLTVSEATIYSRFGFASAAMAADLTIDMQRVRWVGPMPSGRVQFISPEQLRDDGRTLMERARERSPGEIEMQQYKWDQILGLAGDKDAAKSVRAIRYDDGEGKPQGFAIYRVNDTGAHDSAQVLDVQYLVAVTDDAARGLWRHLLQMDLIGTVTAKLRPVDEPLGWLLSDSRAVRRDERDHLWARILDVKAALEARHYSAAGRIALEVRDELGIAEGRVLLDIDDDGTAKVTPLAGDAPEGVAELRLGVSELSALYLGGVSAATLVRAGRVTEVRPGSAASVDLSFRSGVAPWLSFWF
jgi:predicted acetyltransferase